MAPFYESTEELHPNRRLGSAHRRGQRRRLPREPRASHVNGVNLTVDGGFLKRVDF
jgi:hypothetical protein